LLKLEGIMKRLVTIVAIVLCIQIIFCGSVQSAQGDSPQTKELNFVFLHGAGGNVCSLQLLSDYIKNQLPAYILAYEQANPGTKIEVDVLKRCYPNDVGINTWASNIADSIDKHFPDKKNLILVGHSMGGKAALYAVAHDIGNLADKVALVVTINSPIKRLDKYYLAGGMSILDYCRARWLLSDQGICNCVAYYDSSQDGLWVAQHKHWLAFISGEAAPLSEQFDVGGVDTLPRDMDDGIIPLSSQYSDGADVIYRGEHGHSDFSHLDEAAGFISGQIIQYLFGGRIECSVFARGGSFEHKADWLPGADYWEDVGGEVLTSSGSLQHMNESYINWQGWEDIIGEYSPDSKRSSYQVNSVKSLPILTSIEESRWSNPDNPEDCKLYVRTRAAPRTSVQVDWNIYQQGLLPAEIERDRYEVEIVTGTPFTNIRQVSWLTDDPRDLRIQIYSEADSPFRWFKAEWRVYSKEIRLRKVIDEISD